MTAGQIVALVMVVIAVAAVLLSGDLWPVSKAKRRRRRHPICGAVAPGGSVCTLARNHLGDEHANAGGYFSTPK